jgi:hypothetical protein
MANFLFAGNRALPKLLLVTVPEVLQQLLDELNPPAGTDPATLVPGSSLLVLPTVPADVHAAAQAVRARLQADSAIAGVVLLGSYRHLPPSCVDVLSFQNGLRATSGAIIKKDLDRYFVWNDDLYGDRDGDGMPELPVSRVPAGGAVLAGALQATVNASNDPPCGVPKTRSGIRNDLRPYAQQIYDDLSSFPGFAIGTLMEASAPFTVNDDPYPDLAADHVYLALHGDSQQPGEFKGDGPTGTPLVALNLAKVPAQCPGTVVFAGCCWSALIGLPTAARKNLGDPVVTRTAADSIALAFLAGGARAFVGFTGQHYPPLDAAPQSFSAPLHMAFWHNYNQRCLPPAQALFAAKATYLQQIKQATGKSTLQIACEYKAYWSVTCLGLGW